MSIVLMFMLTATITPFVFIHLKKQAFAVGQTILLVGMWLYFFQSVFNKVPAVFSLPWIMFYVGLTFSFVAWAMLIVHMVNTAPEHQGSYE